MSDSGIPAIRRLAGKNYPPGGHFCRGYDEPVGWPKSHCLTCMYMPRRSGTNRAAGKAR